MGNLYIVGTPIGNLEDITQRALRVLREATIIAAEDTRQTRRLLSHFDIHVPLTSYHEHNQRTAGPVLIERMMAGADVALVTDAGMPAISDPGEGLVRLAIEAGIPVIPVPGPTAFSTALVISGLPTEQFTFVGFLPHKARDRRTVLDVCKNYQHTWILYEAPHRVLGTLKDLQEVLGERPMAAARELTKVYEEVVRGTPSELIAHFTSTEPRGEFVLVIGGEVKGESVPDEQVPTNSLVATVNNLIASGVDRKDALKEVARQFGVPKRSVYQAVLEAKETGESDD